MNTGRVNKDTIKAVLEFQRNEITEYYLYSRLSDAVKDENNSKVLKEIAGEELEHYHFWKGYTNREVGPNRWMALWFYCIARLFGLTFGIKLMEGREDRAQSAYGKIAEVIPGARRIAQQEDEHERKLIAMVQEELLQYVGSIVLGLNDALVELTGTLAGLTFALRDTRLIALAGLITGIAASLSMAASEYLSSKSERDHNHALKSAIYTGSAYILTVTILVLPYLVLHNYMGCLVLSIAAAVMVIFIFNFYISVAKDLNFWKRFWEMAAISLGVAFISFVLGYVIRLFLGVEI